MDAATERRRDGFSIVVPVKDEATLLSMCLQGCCALDPGEVIICTDKPADPRVVKAVEYVRRRNRNGCNVRILEVERDPGFIFHQANVRRSGYLAARFDRILTLDADDVVNRKALRAVQKVGTFGLGLVSVSKLHYPIGVTRFWRTLMMSLVRFSSKLIGRPMFYGFSGVYASYRPYWLQTDDLEKVRQIKNPKQNFLRGTRLGEDTHLHLAMKKKFKVSYEPVIGAVSMRDQHEDGRRMQYELGLYVGSHPRGFLWCAIEIFCFAHADYVRGFFAGRRLRDIENRAN